MLSCWKMFGYQKSKKVSHCINGNNPFFELNYIAHIVTLVLYTYTCMLHNYIIHYCTSCHVDHILLSFVYFLYILGYTITVSVCALMGADYHQKYKVLTVIMLYLAVPHKWRRESIGQVAHFAWLLPSFLGSKHSAICFFALLLSYFIVFLLFAC